MSSSSQEERAEVIGELRQFHGLSESFFRAAAMKLGMTVTDMQVIDILKSAGATSAGQLADLTGLTGGAITGMLNRLEEIGLVRRERDKSDGRRVIVQFVGGKDEGHEVNPVFASLEKGWDGMMSHYNNEQIAFLLEFLKSSNELSRQEIARIRETPEGERNFFSVPLGGVESGRLVVSVGISRLVLRADDCMTELYQARFDGPVPDVKTREGVVSINSPKRLWGIGGRPCTAEVALSAAIPWQIVIQGGAAEIEANLDHLNLAGLEIKGGLGMTRMELPTPSGVVPLRISDGAGEVTIHRPAGVAARVHLKGWVSELQFDGQTFNRVGKNMRLQSPDADLATQRYDIEIANSAIKVSIISG